MQINSNQVIVWLTVGAVAGSLAGATVTRAKTGFGSLRHIGMGLVGALVGGFLFGLLGIRLGPLQITLDFSDLFAAAVGALLCLLAMWFLRKKWAREPESKKQV